MADIPKDLLRQVSTNRIYVATPLQALRADMVPLDPREVKRGSGGYEYHPIERFGLNVPDVTDEAPSEVAPPAAEPEAKDKEVSEKPEGDTFEVKKIPSKMSRLELRTLADEINARFPELALVFEPDAKRGFMISKCAAALNQIAEMAEQE